MFLSIKKLFNVNAHQESEVISPKDLQKLFANLSSSLYHNPGIVNKLQLDKQYILKMEFSIPLTMNGCIYMGDVSIEPKEEKRC